MGYHVLNYNLEGEPFHEYFKTKIEIANSLHIGANSIILEGGETPIPFKLGSDKEFSDFSNHNYLAGMRAQLKFKQQAEDNGLILQELNQDQESYKHYKQSTRGKSIKRGDYIIRNLKNVEVEVKCLTIYNTKFKDRYFYLSVNEVSRHANMISFTKTPVCFAIYSRRFDEPENDEVSFFDLEEFLTKKESFKKTYTQESEEESYMIPCESLTKGFDFLQRYQ